VFELIKPGITDMVNTPDFNSTVIRIDDTEVDYDSGEIKDFTQCINSVCSANMQVKGQEYKSFDNWPIPMKGSVMTKYRIQFL